MLSAGLIVGVPVAGPFGDDFMLAGLTREGAEFLAGIQDEQVWTIVRAMADDQWSSVTISWLVTVVSRDSRATTHTSAGKRFHSREPHGEWREIGGESGTRTPDQRIMIPLL